MVAASLARHVRLARLSCGLCGWKEAIRAENRPARLRRAGYFRAVLRDEPGRRSRYGLIGPTNLRVDFFLLGTREPPGLRRRSAMWAFFVFAALAVLEKGLIGIVIPSLVIGTWILVVGEWNVLKNLYLPSGLALFLTIAAPWHVLVAKINPEFLDFYFIR